MDAEVGVVLAFKILDGLKDYSRELLLHVAKLKWITLFSPKLQVVLIELFIGLGAGPWVLGLAIYDKFKSFTNVVTIFTLLLYR